MTQREKHQAALDSFTETVRGDPKVIALLLWGSLAYGTVWEKSDIDLTMIVRDGSSPAPYLMVDADGLDLVLTLREISRFKTEMQRWVGGDFEHSALAKGRIIFSKDASLVDFFEDTRRVGSNDAIISFINAAGMLQHQMHRCEKWLRVYEDNLYAQRFLQFCCSELAHMILLRNQELPTRESILRACELEPELMHRLYVLPSTTCMTKAELMAALRLIDDYLLQHLAWWSQPILQFLSDGEVKTFSHIINYLRIDGSMLNWLAEREIINRVAEQSSLFKKSRTTVEEIAYYMD